MQLPGLTPDAIDVSVENGVLTISGQAEAEEEQKERNYLLRETRGGRFTRSLPLPPTYAADPSAAVFERGVLRLVFPKTEAAKPRRTRIDPGESRATADGPQEAEPRPS